MSATIGKNIRDMKATKWPRRGTDPDNGAIGTDPDEMSPVTPDDPKEKAPIVDGMNEEVNLGPGDVASRKSEVIPEAVQGYQAWRPEKPEDMSDEEWRLKAFPNAEPIPEPYGPHTQANRPEAVIDAQLRAPATTAPSTYNAAVEVPGPNSKADPDDVINPRVKFDETPETYIISAPVASEKALEATKAIEKDEIAPPPSELPPKNFPLTPPEETKPAMTGPDTTTEETERDSQDPALVNVHTDEQNARIADPYAREADAVFEGAPKGPPVEDQDAIRNPEVTVFEPRAVRAVRDMEQRNAPVEVGETPDPEAEAKAAEDKKAKTEARQAEQKAKRDAQAAKQTEKQAEQKAKRDAQAAKKAAK